MMVTFVSQCEKKALSRTRRVLDAFADRIGDKTWQTVITEEGLQAVKKLLRKTASKNTAVSCHWIRSRSRTELAWIVGNKEKFNAQGAVPVNSTQRSLLQSQWENDWHYLPLIKALAALAALLHDWGKASKLFQEKLQVASSKGDPIRHEWISCLLFQCFVHAGHDISDADWLHRLSEGDINEEKLRSIANSKTDKPLSDLPNTASLLIWLIVSHHRLPMTYDDWQGEKAVSLGKMLARITGEWGYFNKRREDENEKSYQARQNNCFEFPQGLMSQSKPWVKQIKKWAKRLQENLPLLEKAMQDDSWRLVLHHARLVLMLGDHFYSSQDADAKWQSDVSLYANTDRKSRELKQKLDEHLTGVMQAALKTAHLLPAFETEPPRVESVPALKRKSLAPFSWQDKAVEKIQQWKKQQTTQQGCFIVNMASTGCGKTMANAKVMRALSDDGDSLRYILALGLRTLTLQTGDEYRDRIGLDDSELAVLIGSKAVMDLHKGSAIKTAEELYGPTGSESEEKLLDDDVDYDCVIPEEGLATVLTDEKSRKFLYAPVLACTIDHIMSATETKRGGRYILPCLRLMSSDLVIDEVDDFTGSDLIAIGRLVHLAGMLGRKVMISSATIPPDLAEGFFNAYREGWRLYSQSRNAAITVSCGWLDEFNAQIEPLTDQQADIANKSYREFHQRFVAKRVDKLKQQPAKRKAQIVDCQNLLKDEAEGSDNKKSKQQRYFELCQYTLLEKHKLHNTLDSKTGIQVSFGVVRVANIQPCVALTDYLLAAEWPENTELRIMSYHSQQILLLRHEQEKHLDAVLKRKEAAHEEPVAFSDPVIRQHLDGCGKANMIFVLVATPVEEVGRDHDFDWAVVEPSSYRSIIQLAGRVRRHRNTAVEQPNIALMQYNLRSLRGEKKAYCKPGYEEYSRLKTHELGELLNMDAQGSDIDAIPRILKPAKLNEQYRLADLEHYATQYWLCDYETFGPENLQGWLVGCWWLTAMPQQLNPFRKSDPTIRLFLVYEDGELYFAEKNNDGVAVNREGVYDIRHVELNEVNRQRLWLQRDYLTSLEQIAQDNDVSMKYASLKYGEIAIADYESQGFEYNDQYGLKRQ